MPRALPTPCSYGRCPELTRDRYCEEHRSQRWKGDDRPNAADRGYDHRWQQVRRKKIRRSPLCERCEEEGRTEPAAVVHHIEPIRDGGRRYKMENLQSLCRSCHRKAHRSDG